MLFKSLSEELRVEYAAVWANEEITPIILQVRLCFLVDRAFDLQCQNTKQAKVVEYKVEFQQNNSLYSKPTSNLIFSPFFCVFSCGREGRFVFTQSSVQGLYVPFNIFGNAMTCISIAKWIQPV